MIRHISINNYALIDRTEIVPDKGFSVITGETGAGKSILLGAIGLTLGQRADASAIMDKSRKCVVEIEYDVSGYGLQGWFEENGLDYEEKTIVRREVSVDGKSRCFINDTPVSNKVLKEFGGFMVDIHSQHQSLLVGRPEYQTEILDAFCGNNSLLEEYRTHYVSYRKWKTELQEMKEHAADAEKEKDYLRFQFSRLEEARLQEGEKEELEEEEKLLSNAENIKSVLGNLAWQLRDREEAVVSVLKNAHNALGNLEDSLKEAGEYKERLESVIIELNDLADETERKAEGIEFNADRIEVVQRRLNTIYDLLYKYKVESVAELIEVREKLKKQLKELEGGNESIAILEKKLQDTEEKMRLLADRLHAVRKENIEPLCSEMNRLLAELGIRHANFAVEVNSLEHFTPTGCDDVRFLFSANKNQAPGDISKVASGGEISRVMLALKYILSAGRRLPVIVFDEIDTGLSGEVAHRMAQILKEMAQRMQVISISHLPQIAAAGDTHFKVYKEDAGDVTVSRMRMLTREERVKELAGMMSGSEISTAALAAAENLLK